MYDIIHNVGDNMEHLDLITLNNRPIRLDEERLEVEKEDFEKFLSEFKYSSTLKHAKEVLFSHEIQANNFIEGYKDDVETIYNIIHKITKTTDPKKKQRILNMYKGYKYILNRRSINKYSLRNLYSILSRDLLSENDKNNMGKYYRGGPVYIYYSNRMDIPPDEGMDYTELDDYMGRLLEFINSNSKNQTRVDLFLKSQIIHFYGVYIHPYFDINGRTSRTLAMWYLLNNKVNNFVIFNRAIQLHKPEYYRVIRETKKFKNATFFLNYMMKNTREELEKDYIMDMIKNSTKQELTSLDFQSLHYILSMNNNLTYADFTRHYNIQNERKQPSIIYKEMIEPLLDKGIVVEGKATQKRVSFTGDTYNHYFNINESLYEVDPNKIKYLKIK